MLTILLTVLHIIVSLILILVVLLQTGKRADLAGAFGGGGSQTVFGTRGAATFLSKLTTAAAIVFMLTSLGLSLISAQGSTATGTVLPAEAPAETGTTAPAAPQQPAGDATQPPADTTGGAGQQAPADAGGESPAQGE